MLKGFFLGPYPLDSEKKTLIPAFTHRCVAVQASISEVATEIKRVISLTKSLLGGFSQHPPYSDTRALKDLKSIEKALSPGTINESGLLWRGLRFFSI